MAFLTYTKPLRTNYTIFLKRKNSQIADIVEKNVPLRALPRTHRPSTSEGMPHPRNFLSGFPVSPSYPFILAFFFSNFLGYGVSVSCSIALIFVYYTKISICRIPAGPQPFFTPFHFPELCLSLA
jgi:hypothetical protein